jgi:hypothetical protein
VSNAPGAVPDEVVPGDELPVDVSVSENGVGIGLDFGASVDVNMDNTPEMDVGTPLLPPVPPVPPVPVP